MRAVVLLLLLGCGAAPAPAIISPANARVMPVLEFKLLSGEAWRSEGRVSVIDVWATYCKPCKKAFPKLDRLAARYPDVAIIAVSVDEEDAPVHDFVRDVPVRFAIGRDPTLTVRSAPLAVRELPTVIVLDRAGRVRFRVDKITEPDYDQLTGVVATLLAE
ncbi:MAG: TlpA family protein disulfide reductase [Kofleriaceae bacterium]